MPPWAIVALFCLALAAPPLYILDCGEHARYLETVLRREGNTAPVHLLPMRLGGECLAAPPFNESVLSIQPPARLLLAWVLPPTRVTMYTLGDPSNRTTFLFFPPGSQQDVQALETALARGVEVYASAGNDGDPLGCPWPAAQLGVRAITAADSTGKLQPFANGCPPSAWRVSACSTSEASAIAAAQSTTLIRRTQCSVAAQHTLAAIVAWVAVFLVV